MKLYYSVLLQLVVACSVAVVAILFHDTGYALVQTLYRRTDGSDVKDYGVGRVGSFSETSNCKPPIPWDNNWDK